jgi:hypothetical protein
MNQLKPDIADEGLTQMVGLKPKFRLTKTTRYGHQVDNNVQSAVDAEHGRSSPSS